MGIPDFSSIDVLGGAGWAQIASQSIARFS